MCQFSPASDSPSGHGNRFDTTCWSVVLAAGRAKTPESSVALESLCEAYWYPLYAFVRRRVSDVNEAQDLTQAFFADLLEKNRLDAATPERGRFRAFLLTSLKHFLSKQWAKARAKKRGGGRRPIPLDFEAADSRLSLEPCTGLTAEQLYQRQWVITLLDQILLRLEQELIHAGKAEHFQQLRDFMIGEATDSTYADVAVKLSMSADAAKMAAHRMRRRYRELLREEIARTVAGPDEVEDEIRMLFSALQS